MNYELYFISSKEGGKYKNLKIGSLDKVSYKHLGIFLKWYYDVIICALEKELTHGMMKPKRISDESKDSIERFSLNGISEKNFHFLF